MRPNDVSYSFSLYLSVVLAVGLLASFIFALVFEKKSKSSQEVTLFDQNILGGKKVLIMASAFALVVIIHYLVICVIARPTVDERTVSLIPFSSIIELMADFSQDRFNEVLCSFAIMVVPGVALYFYLWLFGFLSRHKLYTPLLIALLVGAGAALTTEILQLLFRKGIFETDDILFSMIGCAFGTFLCIGVFGRRRIEQYIDKYVSKGSEKDESGECKPEEPLLSHDEIMILQGQGLMDYYDKGVGVLNAIKSSKQEETRCLKKFLKWGIIALAIGTVWLYLLPWTVINSSALVLSYDTYDVEYQDYLRSMPDPTDDDQISYDVRESNESQRESAAFWLPICVILCLLYYNNFTRNIVLHWIGRCGSAAHCKYHEAAKAQQMVSLLEASVSYKNTESVFGDDINRENIMNVEYIATLKTIVHTGRASTHKEAVRFYDEMSKVKREEEFRRELIETMKANNGKDLLENLDSAASIASNSISIMTFLRTFVRSFIFKS